MFGIRLLAKLCDEVAGFVVGGSVRVIGRAVAGGQAVGFGGVLASGELVASGQREAGEFQVGVRALQDVAAALGDAPRLLGQPLRLVRRARGDPAWTTASDVPKTLRISVQSYAR